MTRDPGRPSGAGPAQRSARALAPAKINPWLDVLGKRADGYHELDTWMLAVDRCDEVVVSSSARTPDDSVRVTMSGPHATPDVPIDASNLAARAVELVWRRARASGAPAAGAHDEGAYTAVEGLHVHVLKRIPSQAGLGGASADAAAAWLAARAVLGLELSLADACSDLASLGSDTVFFAAASETGAARCQGRGEIVVPTDAPRGWSIALVTPRVGAPTALVYRALGMSLRGTEPVPTVPPVAWSTKSPHDARALLGNRLEAAACAAVPELAEWRRLFEGLGEGHFQLSGSGSSFFGLYESDGSARSALVRIEGRARELGLGTRVLDVVHPLGHGARLVGNPRLSEDA